MHLPRLREIIIPALVFCACLTLSVGAYIIAQKSLQREMEAQFDTHVERLTTYVGERMNLYTNVLRGAQGLFAANDAVSQSEWRAYIAQLDMPRNYGGVSALLYVDRVKNEDVDTYPIDIHPRKPSGDYYPFALIAVASSTAAGGMTDALASAMGFDVSSDPVRSETLTKAAETGELLISGVTKSIVTGMPIVTVFAPIYEHGAPSDTPEERVKNLTGFAAATFRLSGLVDDLSRSPLFDPNIKVTLFDDSDTDALERVVLFETGPKELHGNLSREENIVVGGRAWTVRFDAGSLYGTRTTERLFPFFVLLGGALMSSILSFLYYTIAHGRDRAAAIAANLTRELTLSTRELQRFLDGLTTFVAKVSSSKKILFANSALKSASGLGDSLIGSDFLSGQWFAFDPTVQKRVRDAFDAACQGVPTSYDEQIRVHTTNGPEVLTISFSLIPVGREKESVEYIIAEGRDITRIKRVEDTLRARTDELEKINEVMVDRELKMIELKKTLSGQTS